MKRLACRIMFLLVALVLGDICVGKAITLRTANSPRSSDVRVTQQPYVMSDVFPRDLDTARQRQKTKRRVVIVGGSFAMGAGASGENATYIAHLRDAMPEVEILCLASSSYVARQQYVHFALYALDLQPDAVIVLDGFNDLALPVAFGQRPGHPWQYEEIRNLCSGSFPRILLGILQTRSHLYRMASRIAFSRWACGDGFRQVLYPQIEQEYLDASSMLYRLCRQYSTPVLHFIQPQLALHKPKSADEMGLSLGAFEKAMREYYPKLVTAAKQNAEMNGVPLISLVDMFGDNPLTMYVDYCHLNDAGQTILAERIKRAIDERVPFE